MFGVQLDVSRSLLAALNDPESELENMLKGMFLEIDAMLFGKDAELDKILSAGATGGGPHNWHPLSKQYKRRKAWMRRTGRKVKPYGDEPKPYTVVSTDIWVRTGKFRDKVIRAKLGRKGKSRGSVTQTGLRNVVIKVNSQTGEYGVEIDKGLSYWHLPAKARPILEWTPDLKKKAQEIADKWLRKLGGDMLG